MSQVPLSALLGYWFGIELDQPTGKHDGSVFGVRYFSCLPKYGVFAPPSRVQRCVVRVSVCVSNGLGVTFDIGVAELEDLKKVPRMTYQW